MAKYKITKDLNLTPYGVMFKMQAGAKTPTVLIPKDTIVEGTETTENVCTKSIPSTCYESKYLKFTYQNPMLGAIHSSAFTDFRTKDGYELYKSDTEEKGGSTTPSKSIFTKKNILIGLGIIAGILIVMNWNKVKTILK
jgi:hypothetical protein